MTASNGFVYSSPDTRYGDQDIGYGYYGNYAVAQKFVAPGTGTVSIEEIGAYLRVPATSRDCKFSIWTNDSVNNCPAAMVTNSESDVITIANTTYEKKYATYSTKPVLTCGVTYWLVVMFNSTASYYVYISCYNLTTADELWRNPVYPTWSTDSEWHSHFHDNHDQSIYAVCVGYPSVTTNSPTDITSTSLTGNGNITNTGGSGNDITRRGFCYRVGISGDPTIADSVAYDDGNFGTGTYSKSITNLDPLKPYIIRAYAVNATGTSYGLTVRVLSLNTTITKSPKLITCDNNSLSLKNFDNFKCLMNESINNGQLFSNDIITTYALAYTTPNAYYGGVLSFNGDIHFIPNNATVGQKISASGVVSTYTLAYTTSSAYCGGVLAPNGDIHFISNDARIGQKISYSGVLSTYALVYTAGMYSGGVLTPNGDIHSIAYKIGQKIHIEYDRPFSLAMCCSPFFNKF